MKYDQLKHKQNLEAKLLSILLSLGISEESLTTITVSELREAIDLAYPILSSGSEEAREIENARNKVLTSALETMYYYNLIKKREQ